MKLPSYLTYGLIATSLLLTGCGGGDGEQTTPAEQQQEAPPQQEAPAQTEEDTQQAAGEDLMAQGEEIFTGKGLCSTCHGPDAAGTQLAPDLTDDEWINIETPITEEKIAELVRQGVPDPLEHPAPMPPMGGASLDDQEVQAVSAYVYSLRQ